MLSNNIVKRNTTGVHFNNKYDLNKYIKETQNIRFFRNFLENGDYNIKILLDDKENCLIKKNDYNITFIFVNNITNEEYIFMNTRLFRLDYFHYFVDNNLNAIWKDVKICWNETLTKEILYSIIDKDFIKLCFTELKEETDDIIFKCFCYFGKILEIVLFLGIIYMYFTIFEYLYNNINIL